MKKFNRTLLQKTITKNSVSQNAQSFQVEFPSQTWCEMILGGRII